MKKELTKQYVNDVLKSMTPTLQLAKIKKLVDQAFKTNNFYELSCELDKYQGASSFGQKQRLAELKALIAEEQEFIISHSDQPVDDDSESLKVGDSVNDDELVGIEDETAADEQLNTHDETNAPIDGIASDELDINVELEASEEVEEIEEKQVEEVASVKKPKKKRKSKKETETFADSLDDIDSE